MGYDDSSDWWGRTLPKKHSQFTSDKTGEKRWLLTQETHTNFHRIHESFKGLNGPIRVMKIK